MSFIYLGREF